MNKKRVAIIGSNGQLGTDLVKVLSKNDFLHIFPLTHKDIEIEDKKSIKKVLDDIGPDITISTAAHHRVDEIEIDEESAKKALMVNAIATKNFADYCELRKQVFVFFSTDYVFGADKTRKTPYRETDNPGPISVYGLSKLAGEYLIQYVCSQYFIIRTTGLYGVAGSSGKGGNFVETIIQIAKKEGCAKVVNDQILTPTYTMELAKQVVELIKTDAYGLYHATAHGQCSWYEFAKEIFRLMNLEAEVKAITSEEISRPARRPSYSVLENYNLKKLGIDSMKDWKVGLKEYLKEKGYL